MTAWNEYLQQTGVMPKWAYPIYGNAKLGRGEIRSRS